MINWLQGAYSVSHDNSWGIHGWSGQKTTKVDTEKNRTSYAQITEVKLDKSITIAYSALAPSQT